MLTDTFHTYTWGTDGTMLSVDGIPITYDAFGKKVEINNSQQLLYLANGTNPVAQESGSTFTYAWIPLPGGANAVYLSSGLAQYNHSDWLGSARLLTSSTQSLVGDNAYAPYGEIYAQDGAAGNQFTSYGWSSTVSGVDDFIFRRYHPVQGRWISPDPAGMAAADPANPQTWNRYAYVANSPLNNVDPLGLAPPPPAWNPGSDSGCELNNVPVSCDFANGEAAAGGAMACNGLCGVISGSDGALAFASFDANGNVSWTISESVYFSGIDYGTFITSPELLAELGLSGSIGGVFFPSMAPSFILSLRLVPKNDSCGGGDRQIFYQVQTLNTNNTLGAIPSTLWYVTEHQSITGLAGTNGTTTDSTANQFEDWISGAGQNPVKSRQTFTVSPSLSTGNPSYSIMVRIGNQDYGALGIYTSNPPIVQGVRCPASLARQ